MNQSALESFAQEARRDLLKQVELRLTYWIGVEGATATVDTAEHRQFAPQVKELAAACKSEGRAALIERVAYTWFNRFAALRFMDANGYHPFGAKVIMPATANETLPELLQQARAGTLDADVRACLGNTKTFDDLLAGRIPVEQPDGAVYRLLLVAVCNYYHRLMPFMFEKIGDATELLLPQDLLTEHSIVHAFRTDLADDDCRDVEVIGWLYQFYISKKKESVMARKAAVPKEDIPAVTQLFTPHWIVRYLVENSLGRLWLLNRPRSRLREKMPYFIESEPETAFLKIAKPEDIRLLDPACGSGHMLTYAYDLLYAIYEEEGYDAPDIPGLILRHNLYGVEICDRAGALAAFALFMKARGSDARFFRRLLTGGAELLQPDIISLQDVHFEGDELGAYVRALDLGALFDESIIRLLHQFEEAKNFGSLIQPCLNERAIIDARRAIAAKDLGGQLFLRDTHIKVLRVLAQAEVLTQRYHVVVANPPYMGAKQMDEPLLLFCETNYALGFADLFSCFIERSQNLTYCGGISGLITMQGWLFQPSFVELRRRIFSERRIRACLHLGAAAFDTIGGEVVKTVAFIIDTDVSSNKCQFFDLTVPRGEAAKEHVFLSSLANPLLSSNHVALDTHLFLRIPGAPAFYKNTQAIVELFETTPLLGSLSALKAGLTTGDNVAFQRFWYEVSNNNILYNCTSLTESGVRVERWYPCSSGGEFRKWYRKSPEIVDWQCNGERIRSFTNAAGKLKSRAQNTQYYFRQGFTWNKLSTSNFAVRLQESGWIYDDTSRCGFPHALIDFDRIFSFLCSSVSPFFLGLLNPSMSFTSGDLARLPIIKLENVDYVVKEAVCIARTDWDNFETSWDFRDHPLLRPGLKGTTLEASWRNWEAQSTAAIRRMQELETENNRLFIEAYGLQDELKPDVPEDQITLARADAQKDMAAFISYAVGCMFGRYSLAKPGLLLANAGDTLEQFSLQIADCGLRLDALSFAPDKNGIIPVLDGKWFADDIVGQFRKFLKASFGAEKLEENLAFIEASLGKDLQKYFVRDFYKNHLSNERAYGYKKRPIYWMFSSPEGSFQALIYLHRYTRDTVNLLLNDYLREFMYKLEERQRLLTATSQNESVRAGDRAQALKDLGRIEKMRKELAAWERDVVLPLAQQRIEIDLDDGVKVNYLKFKGALVPIPGLEKKEEE